MCPGRTLEKMVDVRGFEPLTPCLQSRLGKTLNAFAGVACNEIHRNSRSSNVPKLYRSIRIKGRDSSPRDPSTVRLITFAFPTRCALRVLDRHGNNGRANQGDA